MLLYTDNKGVKELANSWTTTGRTRHITTKQHFLRELKEQDELKVVYLPGENMPADALTKNLDRKTFEKHVRKMVGWDEYMGGDNS